MAGRVFASARKSASSASNSVRVSGAMLSEERSRSSIWRIVSSIISAPKLAFLVTEEHVERGHRTIALRDVLLHLNFLRLAQFVVSIKLLFEHAQVVSHHHDFVEEDFDIDVFG